MPIELTVDPRYLAHCVQCGWPMYCIYEQSLRRYCWECVEDAKAYGETLRS